MADELKPAVEPKAAEKPKKAGTELLTTTYVDDSFVLWWKDHLRISFGETIEGKVYWRSAILMEVWAIKNLMRNLTSVLAQLEEQAKEESEKVKVSPPKD